MFLMAFAGKNTLSCFGGWTRVLRERPVGCGFRGRHEDLNIVQTLIAYNFYP